MKKILLLLLPFLGSFFVLPAQTDIKYQPLYSASNTPSVSIDLQVGSTAGDLNVSPSGAATYTIPISIAPGTHGVVPQLSINYSSQAGSGLLGMGWNLSGLSAISRTGKNTVYDGEVTPVKLTNEDFFALDGNRLIVTSGTNGAAEATYATKMETFSKITSYGSVGSTQSPQYFIVEMKNGLIYEYGNSTDSRIMTDTRPQAQPSLSDRVFSWQLNKIRDQYGNYVEYIYQLSEHGSMVTIDGDPFGREIKVREIRYTGNSINNLLPYNKIIFDYGRREDKNVGYQAGQGLASRSLLRKITVTTENDQLVRQYDFSYALNKGISHLRSVQESGSDGLKMNPTYFRYGNGSEPIVLVEASNNPIFNSNDYEGNFTDAYKGDFNGDGFDDILSCSETGWFDTKDYYYQGLTIMLQKPSADGTLSFSKGASRVYSLSNGELVKAKLRKTDLFGNSTFDSGNILNTFAPVDFNKDGRIDLVTIHVEEGKFPRITKIEVLSPSQDGLTFEISQFPVPKNLQNQNVRSFPDVENFHVGDFDGDGNMDYILLTADNSFVSYPSKQIFNEIINLSDVNPLTQRYPFEQPHVASPQKPLYL
ncbi:MAG: hypothetical protein HC817_08515 [Saprospiraceae bacterium]|nr:hypothetical protein [Saprospiraceae bacterium]